MMPKKMVTETKLNNQASERPSPPPDKLLEMLHHEASTDGRIEAIFRSVVSGGHDGAIGIRHFAQCEAPSSAVLAQSSRMPPVRFIRRMLRCQTPSDRFYHALSSIGGQERLNTLIACMRLDPDGSGSLGEDELRTFNIRTDLLVDRAVNFCQTMAVVGTLMIALTHKQSIGVQGLVLSDESVRVWGEQSTESLLWTAYSTNVCTEVSALCLLCQCVYGRRMLSNVLPTKMDKLEYLSRFNVIGAIAKLTNVTVCLLTLTIAFGALTYAPYLGIIGASLVPVILVVQIISFAPHQIYAMSRLHAEARNVIARYDRGVVARAKDPSAGDSNV